MNLAGIKVLITRPQQQAEELARSVAAAGGNPLVVPLITITALDDEASLARLGQHMQALDLYHALIFVSSNAARHAVPWIQRFWPEVPPALDLIAVGASTAAALNPLHCRVQTAAPGAGSEELLSMPVLQDVKGKRIGICRGQGGRELLATELRKRGATVEYLELYRRDPVTLAPGQLNTVLAQEKVQAIVVTSGQILQTLSQECGCSAGSNNSQAGLIPLLVPSVRVAEQAAAQGFSRVLLVNGADDAAILSGLETVARQHLE